MALPTLITFSPNTTIRSSEVNTNFTNLRDRTQVGDTGQTIDILDDINTKDIDAENIRLINAGILSGKDTGATDRDLVKINASDQVVVGKNDEADHTIINAGSNKLVKTKILRQNNTANSYEANTVILVGWGQIGGDGTSNISETVTFGVTFSADPIIMGSNLGVVVGGSASDADDFTSAVSDVIMVTTNDITTTTFTIDLRRDSGSFTSGNSFGYSWIAIGQL